MNGRSCMGFCFCAGLSLFIYMSGGGLVGSEILIEFYKLVLFGLAMLENKSSIDGHHVIPVLGFGYPIM